MVGASLVVFWLTWVGAIHRPFLDDDWGYLNTVQEPQWWHSSAVWNPADTLYRPLLYLWFGLLHLAFGLHPLGFHIATSAVVAVVGVLTWRIALAAGLTRGAAVAGVVVALYPAAAYPISWTSAASSPISVAFALGAILLLLSRSVTPSRSVLAALLLLLGLLSREVVIMAPAVVMIVAWARPGGTLKEGVTRSVPLWIVGFAYVALRIACGAGNPPGPYHQQVSLHALDNVASLVFDVGGLYRGALQIRILADFLLVIFLGATLAWSLLQRRYLVLAGLLWYGLGLLPVVFLVNHPPDPYYVDFALPGIALAIGAGCEPIVHHWPSWSAVVAALALLAVLGLFGHYIADAQFRYEFGGDMSATRQLLASAEWDQRHHPTNVVVVRVPAGQVERDRQLITSRGDLFRVVFHDPWLRVQILPEGAAR